MFQTLSTDDWTQQIGWSFYGELQPWVSYGKKYPAAKEQHLRWASLKDWLQAKKKEIS